MGRKRRVVVDTQEFAPVAAQGIKPTAVAEQQAQRNLAQLVDGLRRHHTRAILLAHLSRALDDFLCVESPSRYLLVLPGQGAMEPKFDDVFEVRRELVLAARAARRRFRELQQTGVDSTPVAPLPLLAWEAQDEIQPFDDVADADGFGDIIDNPAWGAQRSRRASGA
jgi:hypothetical protein